MPYTRGFDPSELLDHFDRHGAEVGAASPEEYQWKADTFLGRPLEPPIRECKRNNGDRVRFDPRTDEFGILSAHDVIRTYFTPKPRASGRRGKLQYFLRQCRE